LVLAGCVPPIFPFQQHKATSTTSTPAPDTGVSPDLKPYYTQTLHWTTCGNFQCTDAKAPLDWKSPAEGSISLALIRQPAKGKKLGSLLVNPGGPGGSGYDFVQQSVNYAVDSTLQQNYDIVGFDPPGVGHSTEVKCYDPKQMDSYLYDITPGTVGSDAWIAAQEKLATQFGQACKKNTGALLDNVDTVTAARDLDLLRAVLGDKKLTYLGYSYGTYLGTIYAKLYPKNVGRMVLDGALDPAASNFEVTKVQSEGFESALRAYLQDCITNNKQCPFKGDTVDSAMQTIGNLLASVQASPIRNSDGRELGANSLLTAIIYPLYDASAWPVESQMFASVMKGDAGEAFQLADEYNGRNSNGTYQDNSTEAFMAINCLDYSYNDDPAVMHEQAAELDKAAPTIGPYFGYGDISCATWPYKTTVQRGPVHAPGTPPIIVVGTTNDPATPYVWAQNLAKELDSGHLVTYHGQGHTAYNKSNSCVNDAVDNYFVHGTVPAKDPMC
jgi:pimeloyl-ACP methyl ester carboxylesterase